MFCCFEVMSEKLKRHMLLNRPTKHDTYQKNICRGRGGVIMTLDGMCDYSTSPPIFKPHNCGKFSGAIIIDDVHNTAK